MADIRNRRMDDPEGQKARVFVGNIPTDTQREDLQERFAKHGNVLGVMILKGFAFVQFETEKEAMISIEKEQKTEFNGCVIDVKAAKKKPENLPAGGGGGPVSGQGMGGGQAFDGSGGQVFGGRGQGNEGGRGQGNEGGQAFDGGGGQAFGDFDEEDMEKYNAQQNDEQDYNAFGRGGGSSFGRGRGGWGGGRGGREGYDDQVWDQGGMGRGGGMGGRGGHDSQIWDQEGMGKGGSMGGRARHDDQSWDQGGTGRGGRGGWMGGRGGNDDQSWSQGSQGFDRGRGRGGGRGGRGGFDDQVWEQGGPGRGGRGGWGGSQGMGMEEDNYEEEQRWGGGGRGGGNFGKGGGPWGGGSHQGGGMQGGPMGKGDSSVGKMGGTGEAKPNDVEIICLSKQSRVYAENIEDRLKNMGLDVDVLFPNPDIPIGKVLGNIAFRGVMYAIVIGPQNDEQYTLTLNILQGQQQEHRNMPVDDAMTLISKNFSKVIIEKGSEAAAAGSSSHPTDIKTILGFMVENRPISLMEYDKMIKYLVSKREGNLREAYGDNIPAHLLHPPVGPQQDPASKAKQEELQQRVLNILNKPRQPATNAGVPGINPTLQQAIDSLVKTGPNLLSGLQVKATPSSQASGAPTYNMSGTGCATPGAKSFTGSQGSHQGIADYGGGLAYGGYAGY